MPLILAIEPDRRQAAQLTGVIRQHVGAELILADTTEGALVAIGHRVPDLVLVPALLAPQDDAALASALRVIAAAAHVRTLTIPAFANGIARKTRTGMFARLGLGREEQEAPDGCLPSVFGEQVVAYLQEAAQERSTQTEPEASPVEQPAIVDEQPAFAPEIEAEIAAPELLAVAEPLPAAEESDAGAAEAAPDADSVADDEDNSIDLSDELSLLSDSEDEQAADRESDDESVEVYSLDADPLIDNIADFEAALKEHVPVVPIVADVADDIWEEDEPEAGAGDPDDAGDDLWMPLSLAPRWPSWQPTAAAAAAPAAARTQVHEETRVQAAAAQAETPRSEWVELIESLRLDIERLKNSPTAATRSKDKSKADTRKHPPVQDEWGFFDPQQCGFAALLAKLDEITDTSDEASPRAH